jgi:ABC-type polysaccharide/polyol phosphate transport system ATPase subunit
MGELAIEIKNLSKRFKDRTVIERLNLTVEKGETIGIIGANGTGKSTLLRILSGIIKPSEGIVCIHGSVTSILEVGNGFHPDLTGRENCYLSARLRGYSDSQIEAGMDHVIAFSELEDAIDIPIKHYSNGMYLRLAFSLFERFHSDILLLDEVLSVGDAAFREKIARVIRRLKEEGKTILMVSHNMNEIVNFCDRVIHIAPGNTIDSTEVRDVIDDYLFEQLTNTKNADNHSTSEVNQDQNGVKIGNINLDYKSDLVELTIIEFLQSSGSLPCYDYSKGIEIQLCFNVLREPNDVHLIIKFFDLSGNLVVTSSTAFQEQPTLAFESTGGYKMKITLPGSLLNKGIYTMSVLVSEGDSLNVCWYDVARFKIIHDDWLNIRPWSSTPSLILTQFPTSIERNELI